MPGRASPDFARVLAEKRVDAELAGHWREWAWLPDGALVLAIAVFTDGAASLAPGAVPSGGWGLLVLAAALDCSGQVRFGLLGAACGPVTADKASPHFRGASSISAPTTEITALLESFVGLQQLSRCRSDFGATPDAPHTSQ